MRLTNEKREIAMAFVRDLVKEKMEADFAIAKKHKAAEAIILRAFLTAYPQADMQIVKKYADVRAVERVTFVIEGNGSTIFEFYFSKQVRARNYIARLKWGASFTVPDRKEVTEYFNAQRAANEAYKDTIAAYRRLADVSTTVESLIESAPIFAAIESRLTESRAVMILPEADRDLIDRDFDSLVKIMKKRNKTEAKKVGK